MIRKTNDQEIEHIITIYTYYKNRRLQWLDILINTLNEIRIHFTRCNRKEYEKKDTSSYGGSPLRKYGKDLSLKEESLNEGSDWKLRVAD